MIFKFCPNCGVKNNDGKEDFKCTNCGKSFYQNSKPTASVIPIFQNREILMSVRREDPRKGRVDFIGGFLNNGEDPLEGAVREFEEETGLKIEKEKLEFLDIKIDEYHFQEDTLSTFNVTYTIDFPEKIQLTPQDDVEELVWVDITDPNIHQAFPYQQEVFNDLMKKLS